MLSHFTRSNALLRNGINRMGLTATKHQTRTLTNLNVGVLKETEAGECKFIKNHQLFYLFNKLSTCSHNFPSFCCFIWFHIPYPSFLAPNYISISVLNSFSLNFQNTFHIFFNPKHITPDYVLFLHFIHRVQTE